MESKLNGILKDMREGETQQQVAMSLNISRESVSAYETGRAKLQPDISRELMKRKENPWLALAIRNEYTQTGPVFLDGPNADLHRSSVKEKVLEEMLEAIEKIKNISFSKPLKNFSEWEKPELEGVLEEVVEALTAMEHFAAIICEETDISYIDTWRKHYSQLEEKGYVQS